MEPNLADVYINGNPESRGEGRHDLFTVADDDDVDPLFEEPGRGGSLLSAFGTFAPAEKRGGEGE